MIWIRVPSSAFNGAIPNLAEADMVIASEAISAAQIRTIRLIAGSLSIAMIAMSGTSSRQRILFQD